MVVYKHLLFCNLVVLIRTEIYPIIIANGDEAQRLADLWNLDPYDSEVETMVSHLSRAILMREIAEQERKECHQQLSETTPLESGN